ncbi:hypothetical protein DERF_009738 [Dermatophagoides farinae]|uniref:Uncharacterized protein n=1 Tax=Dermatophagoides farinae TaxID=6954 RepID=A0A922L4A9_DERFA|nr:hypothetical protein DERF_009738 [Dermatophagoides farinae]
MKIFLLFHIIIVVVVGKTSSLQHGNHYICNDNKLIQIIEWESLPNGTIRLFELDAYYEINDVIDKIVSGPFRPLPYELNQMNPKTFVLYSTILNDVIKCNRTICSTTSTSMMIKSIDFEINGLTQLTRIDQQHYPMAIGLVFDSDHNVYLIVHHTNTTNQSDDGQLEFRSLNRTFSGGRNQLNQLITLPNKYLSFNRKNQICMIDSIGVSKFDLCMNDVHDGDILGCRSLTTNVQQQQQQQRSTFNLNMSITIKSNSDDNISSYYLIPYAIGIFIITMLIVGYVVLNCDKNFCRHCNFFTNGSSNNGGGGSKDTTLKTEDNRTQQQQQQQQPAAAQPEIMNDHVE